MLTLGDGVGGTVGGFVWQILHSFRATLTHATSHSVSQHELFPKLSHTSASHSSSTQPTKGPSAPLFGSAPLQHRAFTVGMGVGSGVSIGARVGAGVGFGVGANVFGAAIGVSVGCRLGGSENGFRVG